MNGMKAKTRAIELDDSEIQIEQDENLAFVFNRLEPFFDEYFKNRNTESEDSSVLKIARDMISGLDYWVYFLTIVNYQVDIQKILIPMARSLASAMNSNFKAFFQLPTDDQREILDNLSWTFRGKNIAKKTGWQMHRFYSVDDVLCIFHRFANHESKYHDFKARTKELYQKASNFKDFLGIFNKDWHDEQLCQGCALKCPSPAKRIVKHHYSENTTSCVKRFLLFLRWISRDIGYWDFIPRSKLLVPLDLTVKRVMHRVGVLPDEEGCAWHDVVEVTKYFRKLDPVDPMRFDFLVSRLGILKICNVELTKSKCYACPLAEVCKMKYTNTLFDSLK